MSSAKGFLKLLLNISIKPNATKRQKEAKRVTSPRMIDKITKWCFAFLLLCGWAGASAQSETGQYPVDFDTNYVKDYRHRFNLSFLTEAKQNTINALSASKKIINYQTNLPLPTYGIMFSYRWLNAQLSIPLPGISYTRPDRVETRSYALGLGFTARKWYLKNFVEYFKGYYMSNPEVVFPEYIQGETKPYNDMESFTYYFTAYYGFNGKNYSHRALLWQSETQKKSAGSLLMGLTGGYKWIAADQSIFYSDELNSPINGVQYYVVGLNVGYAYTLKLSKRMSISGLIVPGANYFVGRYNSTQQTIVLQENSFGLNAEGRLQLFYEKGNFFSGLGYTGYVLTSFLSKENPVGSTHNYLRFNFGYRFKLKPIKFLKPFGLSN